MGSHLNEANLQRAFDAWNARDLDGYLALYDDSIELHGSIRRSRWTGRLSAGSTK